MDTEVFTRQALETAYHEAEAEPEREHVTPFIWRQPDRFRLSSVVYERDASRHRWTVDTPEDFTLIRKLIEALYPTKPAFTLEDCLSVIESHPEWSELNAHIEQKAYGR
jgi:spore coat polysaccharide biosynthesis protein SpsF